MIRRVLATSVATLGAFAALASFAAEPSSAVVSCDRLADGATACVGCTAYGNWVAYNRGGYWVFIDMRECLL